MKQLYLQITGRISNYNQKKALRKIIVKKNK
jgi:hypothetical protein